MRSRLLFGVRRYYGVSAPSAVRAYSYSATTTQCQQQIATVVDETARIRNFGVIAHVDAGKTTTSERMLFYTGRTRQIGGVDSGDTVLDFLEEERSRGITIQSALTNVEWGDHSFNLVDSPGHADFAVEVHRCLRVLDGVVCVLDAVAGVEAQTEAVWSAAQAHKLPAIMFVNKMDRDGASLDRSVSSIKSRLGIQPMLLQLPLTENDHLAGVIDLIKMQEVRFDGESGENINCTDLEPSSANFQSALDARERLLDLISENDDRILELYLEDGPELSSVSADDLRDAVRKQVLSRTGVAVLCGSSLRNLGVQPLLDGIASYLPSPLEVASESQPVCDRSGPLSALVFKLVHDRNRGPIAFVRIYSGAIRARDLLRLQSQRLSAQPTSARVHRLMKIDANSFIDVDEVVAGDMCAIVGLKQARTGDTISAGNSASSEHIQLVGINTPSPVFFCSVEPVRSDQQDAMELSLAMMQQEDPSLEVSLDEDTGQTLLKGMGELHLDIVQKRLLSQYQVETVLGRMQVSYRESIQQPAMGRCHYDGLCRGRSTSALVEIEVEPNAAADGTTVVLSEVLKEKKHSYDMICEALRAIEDVSGVLCGFPLHYIDVIIRDIEVFADSTPEAIYAASSRALVTALRQAEPVLMEPYMRMQLQCHSESVGDVLSDLCARGRAQIHEMDTSCGSAEYALSRVDADVPLSEMIGYSTILRSLTHGSGHFTASFSGYKAIPEAAAAGDGVNQY